MFARLLAKHQSVEDLQDIGLIPLSLSASMFVCVCLCLRFLLNECRSYKVVDFLYCKIGLMVSLIKIDSDKNGILFHYF